MNIIPIFHSIQYMKIVKKIHTTIVNKHFLSLVGNVIMSGFGLIIMTLIYRSLSKFDAGVWVFFQSILLLVDSIRSGFLTTAFIKFYAGSDEDRRAEVAGSSWYIGLMITGILILISLSSIFYLNYIGDEGIVLFFKWSGLYYAVSLPWFLASCVIQGEQKFDRFLYLRLSNQGSFTVFVVTLIIIGKATLSSILYAYLLSNFITSVFALSKGWTSVSTIRSKTWKTIVEIYHFGKYSVGSSLSSNMFGTSNAIIINFFLGKPALAIYNLGQSLMQLVEIPLRSFASTGMPSLAAAYNQGNRVEVIQIMKKYSGMITVFLIPAALIGILFADAPIYFIGGGKYVGTEAANVFRIFLIFSILAPPERFFALTLDIIHKPHVNFYKVLIMLVVNVAADLLGYYLTRDIYGISFLTFLPTMVGALIGFWALNQYYKFSYWSIFQVGYHESVNAIRQAVGKHKPSENPILP